MGEVPDLIVGVDFGMTYTGVAYVNYSSLASEVTSTTNRTKVLCIQEWPGKAQGAQNKVPTTLSYANAAANKPQWGFRAENQRQQSGSQYHCWFKTYLDPEILESVRQQDPEDTPSQEQVYRWTEDYLHQLYVHTKTFLSHGNLPAFKSWDTATVQILFTVPTTWDARVVAKFKEIAKKAGWGACRTHTVTIGLTEAEAAAVHAACEGDVVLSDDEIILVCDAGGGTTDLSVLQVTGVQRGVPNLRQLMAVKGETIGSTHIDGAFAEFVQAKLFKANELEPLMSIRGDPIDLEEASWSMTKGEQFQDNKCSCGWPDNTDFYVPIPDIRDTYTNASRSIRDGQLKVTQTELRQLFDDQIGLLYSLIDSQLEAFAEQHAEKQISRLVLSGGLGKSSYLQQKLQEKYSMQVHESPTTHMTVHVSREPQLAVCKGVCLDLVGKLRDGQSVLGTRYCRASYGTEVKILYDRKNPLHWQKKIERDIHDKKDYIKKGVEWFIVRGEPIDVDVPIIKRFSRKIKPGDPRDAFRFCDKIITSSLLGDKLPITYDDRSKARELCELKFKFSPDGEKRFKRKNSHWWSFGSEYMLVDYEVRVRLGAADVTFELWFEDEKLSEDRPIEVEWITKVDSGKASSENDEYYPKQDAAVTKHERRKGKLLNKKSILW